MKTPLLCLGFLMAVLPVLLAEPLTPLQRLESEHLKAFHEPNIFSAELGRTQSWFSLCPFQLCAETFLPRFMASEQAREEPGASHEPAVGARTPSSARSGSGVSRARGRPRSCRRPVKGLDARFEVLAVSYEARLRFAHERREIPNLGVYEDFRTVLLVHAALLKVGLNSELLFVPREIHISERNRTTRHDAPTALAILRFMR